MTKFFDAFISYGRADSKAFAAKLQARLEKEGFAVWFDFNDIPLAVDFQNQIDDGIEKASHFLFVIAPHSVNSPYCGKEIELAISLNKRIIPLLHVMQISRETWQQRNPSGTEADWEAYKELGKHESYQNMHPTIRKLNWVYFQEEQDDFEKSLAGLIGLLRSHTDYVDRHTQLLVQALEWERNQKQTRYLLTGEERQQAEAWLQVRFKNEQPPCIPTDLHCEFITESIKNGDNLMVQVFLSYAHQDRETMEKIGNSLRREGITVWTNTTDIQTGEVFEAAIKRGIEQADNMVYLLSPDSVNSTYCQLELALGIELHKRIIPVLVRETEPTQVPEALGDLQYVDLTDNVREEDYLLDESQLLRTLQEDAAYYNEHKILLNKALKWQRQQKNPSILLRGYNLRSAETWLKLAQIRKQHPPTPLQEEFIAESLRQPPLESLDVFISYSRADSDLARKLNDNFQMQGKTTWFDQESIASGADFEREIKLGIKSSDNFLFVISPRSVNSPYCASEVEYAASLNKRFVTVLYRSVNPGDLHPELAKVQWLDFNQNEGDFNANFNQLVRTLDTDREHLHSHTKWLQRALEWEQKHKGADLLLRGKEFAVAKDWLQSVEELQKKPAATLLQREFIEASQKAIEEAEKREKRQQAEMLRLQEERTRKAEELLVEREKSARRQRLFLGAVSAALVAAVGVSLYALRLWRLAEQVTEGQIKALGQFSSLLNESGRNLDALVEGIRAGRLRKNLTKEVKPAIEEQVLTVLQAAVYQEGFRQRDRLRHEGWVNSVVFSPDGKTIASASYDKTVKLWNLKGEQLHTLEGHEGWVNSVVFSPDGKTIASASADKTVKLWNLEGQLLHTLEGHEGWVRNAVFSPDGKTIASASYDKTVKLWNLEGQLLHTLEGHEDWVRSAVFSPDGKTIASASEDKTVKLWNLEGKLLQTLKGHEATVTRAVFSPDGKTIASASKDNTVKLWNFKGEELHTLEGHKDGVTRAVFSPDGQTIASASSDKTVKLWNLKGEELHTLEGHEAEVTRAVFSPDGQTIASTSDDKTVKLWNLEGKLLQTLKGQQDGVNSAAFSPDGQTLASASSDKTVKLWKLKGKELQTLKGHEARVNSAAFSPDSQTIASASYDKTVKLWNIQGQLLHTLEGHKAAVISVAFSPDGKTIASASLDKTVKLWNIQGQLLYTFKGHKGLVKTAVFSPDGKTIASASDDKTIKLWNLKGEELQTLKGHKATVNSAVFSPDGQTIASASSDKTVKLWNLKGEELQTLEGHEATVNSAAFSPDGQIVASASWDNTVKLWDFTGKLLQTLKGHQEDLSSVAFSPDGQTIASASDDETVKLWNLKGQLLQTLKGHQAWVSSVVFSPDGQTIASAGGDKTVILWHLEDLTLDALVRDACDWVADYLRHNAPDEDKRLCKDYEE